jgi:hypothetical protein
VLEIAEDRRVDVARLAAPVQDADGLVELVGGLVVLAVVLGPVRVGVAGAGGLEGRRRIRDSDEPIPGIAAGGGGRLRNPGGLRPV